MRIEWASKEWHKSLDEYEFQFARGTLQHAWESAARQRLFCGSFLSACSTGEETRANSSGEATMSFCKGMEQPLAESPTTPTREERELQASRRYGTPQVDLRQMLEGDVPQDTMTMCYFCN